MAFIDREQGYDPTGGIFGTVTRKLNLPERGWSEFIGGEMGSLIGPDQSSQDYDPSLPAGQSKYIPQTLPDGTVDTSGDTSTGDVPTGDVSTTPGTTVTVGDVPITYTESGDILGLEELKETQGYLDYVSSNPGATGQDYLDYLSQGGAEQDAINSIFDESSSLIDQGEQNLRDSKGDLLNIAGSPYDQAALDVTASGQVGEGNFEEGTAEAQGTGRNLLSSAQRLANELMQRNRQMFGGAQLSSAAQAAGELLGRESQRQFGGIREQTAKAVQSLKTGLIEYKNQISTKLDQLKLQKSEALSKAELAFRDQLYQIQLQRGELASLKASAQLDLLREFRQQVSDIEAQAREYTQTMNLMWEQAKINTQQQLTAVQGTTGAVGGQIGDINASLGAGGADLNAAITSSQGIEQPQQLSGLYTRRDDQEENIFQSTPNNYINTNLLGGGFQSSGGGRSF